MRVLNLFNFLRRFLPNIRGKNRILMLMVQSLPWQPIASAYGVKLFGDRKDHTYQYAIIGAYGKQLAHEINKLSRDAIFLDIGANIGLYTVLAGRHLNQGHVVCFEPNPFTYRHLINNIRYHRLANVTMLPCALGSGDWQMQRLNFKWSHMGKASLIEKQEISIEVLVSGKGLLDTLNLPDRSAVFVKVDVEGAEIEVLKTLGDWSGWARVSDIYIEISRKYHDEKAVEWIYAFMQANAFAPRYAHREHYDQHFQRIRQN